MGLPLEPLLSRGKLVYYDLFESFGRRKSWQGLEELPFTSEYTSYYADLHKEVRVVEFEEDSEHTLLDKISSEIEEHVEKTTSHTTIIIDSLDYIAAFFENQTHFLNFLSEILNLENCSVF